MRDYLLCVSTLLKTTRRKLDDIEWENPEDPRIEGLVSEIRYYEDKIKKGDLYEPNF